MNKNLYAAETANTQANGDDYEFLTTVVNGNLRYIPLTHTPALNGQNDGGNLICMGENVCGGVSGRARTQLAAATDQSLVIGEGACSNWNVTSTSTTGALTVIGNDALKNTLAAGNYTQMLVQGTRCAAGLVGTRAGNGITCIGYECHRDYQPGGDSIAIGHLNNNQRPIGGFDSATVKVGRGIQRLATQAGGSRQTLLGANIMESCTCTFAENNYSVMIGYGICSIASGGIRDHNVFIGDSILSTGVITAGNSAANTIIGGNSLSGAAAVLPSSHATLVGANSLVGAAAGLGTDDVVIGARTFVVNTAALNANLVCIGSAQTGIPAASEVMIGRGCAASTVAGRLSFGNAMEAVAGAANAGAAALPATPQAFMPLNYNGVAYKIPLYLP